MDKVENIIFFLNFEGAEKVVGWALSHHLMMNHEAAADAWLVISGER